MKAHRNEEEETASKVVSKNVTLEQRVDHLIAKSSRSPAPPSPTNGVNNRPYGRPPFQSNFRPRGDYKQDHGHPPMDIQQNLRGPETSAADPFREADGSRPIQCFRCHGWGHPKRLCPSRLNYTWGGSGMGQSLPDDRQETRRSPSPEPISSAIDMKVSQVTEKYHNPDPLVRLIGPANEAIILIEGPEFQALIDSGAQLSTMSEALVQALKLPVHNLHTLIKAEVSGGDTIPYVGYVEVRLQIPSIQAMNKDSLFMVSNNSPYMDRVPIQLGTLHIREAMKSTTQDELAKLSIAWKMASFPSYLKKNITLK